MQVAYKTWSLDEQREMARHGRPNTTQQNSPNTVAHTPDNMYAQVDMPGGGQGSAVRHGTAHPPQSYDALFDSVRAAPQRGHGRMAGPGAQYGAIQDGDDGQYAEVDYAAVDLESSGQGQTPVMMANAGYVHGAPANVNRGGPAAGPSAGANGDYSVGLGQGSGQPPQPVYLVTKPGTAHGPEMYRSLNTAPPQTGQPQMSMYNHLEKAADGTLVSIARTPAAAASKGGGQKGSHTGPKLRAGAAPRHSTGADAHTARGPAPRNPYNRGTTAQGASSPGQPQTAAQGQTANFGHPTGDGAQVAGGATLVKKRYQNGIITGPAPTLRAQQAPSAAGSARPGGRLRGAGVGGSGATAKSGLALDPRNSRMAAGGGTRC